MNVLIVICSALAAQAPAPASPVVNDLLDRLEASAETLESFTAVVWYEIQDDFLRNREIRRGEIIYSTDPKTGRKQFAVIFNDLTTGNMGAGKLRRNDRKRHYIFDGQWLAEIDHKNRSFVKHQIVPPGKELNPLKLGEGPFPLPVGQPKAEVLSRFDVQPLGPPEGKPLEKLNSEYTLESMVLVPRAGTTEARDYKRVEIHYDTDTLLPVGIRLVESNGTTKFVRLGKAVRNPRLTADQVKRLDIEEPDPAVWAVSVQPWRGQP